MLDLKAEAAGECAEGFLLHLREIILLIKTNKLKYHICKSMKNYLIIIEFSLNVMKALTHK